MAKSSMTSKPRLVNRGNENEGRGMKIKKEVGTAAWLVIPSSGKSGMEMEQNTHSKTIFVSLFIGRPNVREFARDDVR